MRQNANAFTVVQGWKSKKAKNAWPVLSSRDLLFIRSSWTSRVSQAECINMDALGLVEFGTLIDSFGISDISTWGKSNLWFIDKPMIGVTRQTSQWSQPTHHAWLYLASYFSAETIGNAAKSHGYGAASFDVEGLCVQLSLSVTLSTNFEHDQSVSTNIVRSAFSGKVKDHPNHIIVCEVHGQTKNI